MIDHATLQTMGISAEQTTSVVKGSALSWQEPVVVSGARLDLLDLSDVTAEGGLTIEGSSIEVLRLDSVSLGTGTKLVVHDCVVGTLQISGVSGECELGRIRAGDVRVERVSALHAEGCAVETTFSLDGGDGPVAIDRLQCDRLELSGAGPQAEITLEKSTVRGVTIVRESRPRSLVVETLASTDLLVADVAVVEGPLRLSHVHTTRDCRFSEVRSERGPALELSELLAGFDVQIDARTAGDGPASVLRDCKIDGDLALREADGPVAHELSGVEVDGRLDFDADAVDPEAPRLIRMHDCEVSDVALPTAPLRTPRQVTQFARAAFGDDNPSSLAAIRSGLQEQNRLQEEDQAYAALQSKTSRGPFGPLRRALFGGVLGWGTRVWPPLRVLIVMVAATALILGLAWPDALVHPVALGSVLGAFGIWADIDTGFLSEPESGGFATLKAVCGAAGLTFVTLIVGIVIRKLVR